MSDITKKAVVIFAICYHITMTVGTLVVLNYVYVPDKTLVDKLVDTSLYNVVDTVDGVFFGYVPTVTWPLYSFVIFTVFLPSTFLFIGLTVYTLYSLHRVLVTTHSSKSRFRWNTALMLASRTMNPVMLLIIPLVVCTYMIFMDHRMFNAGLVCAALWAVHGLVNAIATISVFQPYRHVVKRTFCKALYKENYVSSR
ncbi:unnamed protein product [Bursaphelenchus okinawaensis]|uniref:G protein-coupled receptor n=1 Tax=Bursaphelenchus okinawaensis TaxID=465554 RepID=A0A811L066_9BILA|nr:unnamed protein product [Bursaphelenchus okinawaensis]CAG9115126.1 unnamed protein product [Bursaphelenchus okinawaensis]